VEDFFGFTNPEFQEAYVEETFVAEVQHEIARIMKSKGMSRAELARRMKISAPAVTQMLGDEDANLTLRTVARIFDALGEKASITRNGDMKTVVLETKSAVKRVSPLGWGCVVSNDRWYQDADLGRSQVHEGADDARAWSSAIRRAA